MRRVILQKLLSICVRVIRPRRAVRDAILRSLQNLALFPAIGRPQNVEGVRKLVTPKYRYLIYYVIDEGAEEIVILTIRHPARSREYRDV